MLVGRREFAAAHDELTEYLKLEPGDESALQLAKLCNAEHTDEPMTLNRMVDLLFQQNVSPLAELLAKDNRQLVELYRKRIEAVWPKAKFSVSIDWKLGLLLGATSFVGAVVGAAVAQRMGSEWLRRVFLVAVVILAIKTLLVEVAWG